MYRKLDYNCQPCHFSYSVLKEETNHYIKVGLRNNPNYFKISPCWIPTYCPKCKRIISKDGERNYNICRKCRCKVERYGVIQKSSYPYPRNTIYHYIKNGERYFLIDVPQECPICNQYSLVFTDKGPWV